MAGHSKWHNIQHRKAGQDAKRGKVFTKLIREITIAAKLGGGDSDANPRLRAAIDKALSSNMTKDTVQRAVKRGAGGEEGSDMMEMRYEGYGPNGVAVMVDCLTDNKNRTVAEVRHAFSKCGGNLGTTGSVAYLFSKIGFITFAPGCDEDAIMEAAIEAGADDVVANDEGGIEVATSADTLIHIKEALIAANLTPTDADVTMVASTEITLDTLDDVEKLMRLNDMLEDLDDVQKVYTNVDIADHILEQL